MTQEQKTKQEQPTIEDLLNKGHDLFGQIFFANADSIHSFTEDIEKMLAGFTISVCEGCDSIGANEDTATVHKLQLLSEVSRELGALESQIEVFQLNRAHLLQKRAEIMRDVVEDLREPKQEQE